MASIVKKLSFTCALAVIISLAAMFLTGMNVGLFTIADTAGPAITYEIEGTGWTSSKDVTITVEDTAIIVSVTINGSPATPLAGYTDYYKQYTYTASAAADIIVSATDDNTETNIVTIQANELYIDTATPEFSVAVTGTSDSWTSQNVAVTFSQTGAIPSGYTYYYSKDGGNYSAITGNSVTYSASSANGSYTYKAVSGSGISFTYGSSYSILIDKTVPNTPSTNLQSSYYTDKTVGFTLSLSGDGLSPETVYYTTNGTKPDAGDSSIATGSTSITFPANGTYTVKFIAIDAVGNTGAVYTRLVRVDDTDYTITFSVSPVGGGEVTGGGIYKRGAEIELSAEANAGYLFRDITDGLDVVSYDSTFIYVVDGSGDKTFTANFVKILTITCEDLEFTYDGSAKSIDPEDDSGEDLSAFTVILYNGSVSAPEDAGSYDVAVTIETEDYYGYQEFTLTINKAQAVISVTPATLTQTYGEVSPIGVTVTTPLAGAIVTIMYKISGTYTTSLPVNAGVYDIRIIVNAPNHELTDNSYQLTIEKADVSIILSDKTLVYNGNAITVNPAVTEPGQLSLSYEYYLGTVHVDNLLEDYPVNAGTYIVIARFSGNSNYNSGDSNEATLIINKKQLEITDTSVELSKIYDGNTSVHVNSPGTLIGICGDDDVDVSAEADYNDVTVALADSITVVFTIDGNEASNYIKPDDLILIHAVITRLQLTISAPDLGDASRDYDGTKDAEVTEGELDNVVSGDTVTVSAEAEYNVKDITATIITVTYEISGADSDNYLAPEEEEHSGSITAKQLTASGTIITLIKTYDGSTDAEVTINGTLSGVVGGETVGISVEADYNSAKVLTANSITAIYTLTGIDSGNYLAPVDYIVSGGVSITRLLLIAEYSYTDSKVYDGDDVAEAAFTSFENAINGDEVTASVSAHYNSALVLIADTITIEYTLEGADISNYDTPGDEVLPGSITPLKIIMNAPDYSGDKDYDGSDEASALVTLNGATNIVGSDEVEIDFTAAYDSALVLDASSITVLYSISGDDSSNYTAPDNYVFLSVGINPLQLVTDGTLDIVKNRVYDATTDVTINFKGALDNAVSGDDVDFDIVPVFNTKATSATSITVTYTLTGVFKDNYLAPETEIITSGVSITKYALSIDTPVVPASKVYDGNTNASVTPGALIDVFAGDMVGVTAAGTYNSALVASAATVTIVYTLTDADKDNYSLANDTAAATITQRQLTMSNPTLTPKTYDNTTAATSAVTMGSITNKVGSDAVTVGFSAVYDDYRVLNVTKVTVTYSITGGAQSNNYSAPAVYEINGATIIAKQLSISGTVVTLSKTYDGSDTAAVTTVGTLSGIIGSDTVTPGATAKYNSPDVANANTITTTYTLDGVDSGNYRAPVNKTDTTGVSISRRTLTIADPVITLIKIYDGTTAAQVTAGALSNKVEGDSLTVSAAASYNLAGVSASSITVVYTISGTDSGNYNKPINKVYSSGVSITPLAVTINYSNLNYVYNGQAKYASASIDNYDAVKHAAFTLTLRYLNSGLEYVGAPTDADTYTVSVDMASNTNYTCTVTAEMVISPAQSELSIENCITEYDTTSPELEVTVLNNEGAPLTGLTIEYTYYIYADTLEWQSIDWNTHSIDEFIWELIESAPIRAGAYKVVGDIATGSNYSSASAEALICIEKAQATVRFESESLTQPYGSVTGVVINTTPETSEGLEMDFIAYYNALETLPVDSGDYELLVVLDDYNYYGSATGTFHVAPRNANADLVINKVNEDILGDMNEGFSVDYDGTAYSIADFETYVDVEGLEDLIVTLTIKLGSVIVTTISDAGEYTLTANLSYTNITGTLVVNFTINKVLGEVTHTAESVIYTGAGKSASGAETTPENLGVMYQYSYNNGLSYIDTLPVEIGTYKVKASIVDTNYEGFAISSITITKADTSFLLPETIEKTYTGSEISLASSVEFQYTQPESYDLVYTYWKDGNLLTSAPINAGTYTVRISFLARTNFLYPDSSIVNYVIQKATPVITLENHTAAYDGTPKTITATVEPSELDVDIVYEYYNAEEESGIYVRGEQIDGAPSAVGVYIVFARILDGGDNYNGAESSDVILTINHGVAQISAVSLILEYTGDSLSITVMTDPAGLEENVVLTYMQGGVEVEPINPGVYTVNAVLDDNTYTGSNTFTLTINKKDISSYIVFSGATEAVYNGINRSLTASAAPFSPSITIKYNGGLTLPKNAGSYTVLAEINSSEPYYSGSATTTLLITKKTLTVTANNATMAYGVDGVIRLDYDGFVTGIDSTATLTRTPVIRITNGELDVDTIGFTKDVVVGSYTITPESAESSNYSFVYVSAVLTVTKAVLTVSAVNTTVNEGLTANPLISYSGYKYQDNSNSVFGTNKPVIKYYETESVLNATLPTAPGIYRIIPFGGEADNYTLSYVEALLIVNGSVLISDYSDTTLNGSFNPNAVLSMGEVDKSSESYEAIKDAVSESDGIQLLMAAVGFDITIDGTLMSYDSPIEFRILIPEKLRGKDFSLLFVNSDGKWAEVEYTVDGNYAVGTVNDTSGSLVFERELNIPLILLIFGGILFIIGFIFLTKYMKKAKAESPKELASAVAPVIAAPLEALEDEDAAFDAYLDKLVEEKKEGEELLAEQAAQAAAAKEAEEEEEELDLKINEADYTKEEIAKLKEKARKAKHLSVEQRITQEVERQLIESFKETQKIKTVMEFTPANVDSHSESEITDEYIIENDMFPNSNVISMEEAQALYPGRGIRRFNGKVALEVCFESALNLAEDKYKYIYSEIKNTFNSFTGVESKMFKSGEAYKAGNLHAIIRMRNENPVIFMNLDKSYIPEDAVYTDRSGDPKYADTPIELSVNSGQQLTAARKMINAMMMTAGLERKSDYKFINYINKYPMVENAILDEA